MPQDSVGNHNHQINPNFDGVLIVILLIPPLISNIEVEKRFESAARESRILALIPGQQSKFAFVTGVIQERRPEFRFAGVVITKTRVAEVVTTVAIASAPKVISMIKGHL